MAYIAVHHGDIERAMQLAHEGLAYNRAAMERQGLLACIGTVGAIRAAQSKWVEATILFGAIDALLHSLHMTLLPVDKDDVECAINIVREKLDARQFDTAWAEGRALTLEQAVALALETDRA